MIKLTEEEEEFFLIKLEEYRENYLKYPFNLPENKNFIDILEKRTADLKEQVLKNHEISIINYYYVMQG